MPFNTSVKVKVVNFSNVAKTGVVVALSNPQGATLQSTSTDSAGYVVFTNVAPNVYTISVSGVGINYEVKNTFVVNPDNIPFENRTFVTSTQSGLNIWTQNQVVQAGTVSGTVIAPNVTTDFTGGQRTGGRTPVFYNPNTNQIVFWSGTNVGQQYNNGYYHETQGPQALQFAQLRINI